MPALFTQALVFSVYPIRDFRDFLRFASDLVSDGSNIAYVEAGASNLPPLLLLHGFPSSTNQFRDLIPLLSSTHHILAPDLPGFGLTTTPANYTFTFASITDTISLFLAALNWTNYAVYIFDYGAPIALRLALEQPDAIRAIVTQNGNAYVEGFGHPFWDPIMALWENPTPAARALLRDNVLTLNTTRYQYTAGVPSADLPLINPTTYTLDYLQNLYTPTQKDHQLDLLYDYRTNVDLYPRFHEYFRKSQVPLLAIWGKGDPAFVPEGAKAYKRDLKDANVMFVDAGHFALETKVHEIAEEVRRFLGEKGC
ncbi:hypothetical protein G7Y79_00018g044730 [Physcia stellaris]|nr:hypothetical protein G7Y79_00018g044730 [Physcia stellaris]